MTTYREISFQAEIARLIFDVSGRFEMLEASACQIWDDKFWLLDGVNNIFQRICIYFGWINIVWVCMSLSEQMGVIHDKNTFRIKINLLHKRPITSVFDLYISILRARISHVYCTKSIWNITLP